MKMRVKVTISRSVMSCCHVMGQAKASTSACQSEITDSLLDQSAISRHIHHCTWWKVLWLPPKPLAMSGMFIMYVLAIEYRYESSKVTAGGDNKNIYS